MCLAKPYSGWSLSRAIISPSRATLAIMEAALISATRASPFTTAWLAILALCACSSRLELKKVGQRLPSTSTKSGSTLSPVTARCMASMVACKIFKVSISCGLARPNDQAIAFSFISIESKARFFSDNFFESINPSIGLSGSRMTAAVTTSPTNGPRPTSSTPAIQ